MSIPTACPNCAWAIKVARERKLTTAARIIFITLAERVSRFTLECRATIAHIQADTGLSARKIRYVISKGEVPVDLLRIRHEGTKLIFTILRGSDPSNTAWRAGSEVDDDPAQDAVNPAPRAAHPAQDAELPLPTPAPRAGNPLREESPKIPPKPHARTPARERVAEGFDQFCRDYPRKEDWGAAYKAYVAAVKAIGGDYQDLLDALFEAKLDDRRFSGDPQFIPLARTWLRAGPWHAPKAKTNGSGESVHAR